MDNSLHNADDLLSSGEAGYSATVAAELQRAYARIKRGQRRVERSHATGGKAHAWLNRPMSARQRMRALYVLAMDHAADRTFMPALEYLEDGLDVAAHLADRGALAELAYLHAAISFAVAQYRTARVSYGVCIVSMRPARCWHWLPIAEARQPNWSGYGRSCIAGAVSLSAGYVTPWPARRC